MEKDDGVGCAGGQDESGEEVQISGVDKDEEKEKEDIVVNGRMFSVDKSLPAKSILSIYCQKHKEKFPVYSSHIINDKLPLQRYFICTVMLEDKKAIGRSKKKREAEMFAARRMVDGNY